MGSLSSLLALQDLRGLPPDELERLAFQLEAELAGLSPEELAQRAAVLRQLHLSEARTRADAFSEYAIPHELTEAPVENAPHHVAWHRFLDATPLGVLISPVEHGKTQQVAIARVLFELGKNPNLRVAVISNTATQAEKILGSIAAHLERNPRVREVFPQLKPSPNPRAPWTSSQITVERSTFAKDASVTALGAGGAILGARFDLIILDDILDFENTRTPEQKKKLLDWFETSLFTRLTAGGRCWVIGTPWAPDDLLHTLAARPAWGELRYAAVLNPDDEPADWIPTWPEQFSLERLISLRDNTTPFNFARKYLTRVRDEGHARFGRADIQRCLDAGRGRTLMAQAPTEFMGGPVLPCFTGVDLGVGQGEGHDLTSMFTIAIDQRQRRLVADIQSGRWTGPEIVRRIQTISYRFRSIVLVESNAAQMYLSQFLADSGVPVVPFQTNAANKYSEAFGVETIAVELRAAQWIIPSNVAGEPESEEVRAWINEMLYYQPGGKGGQRSKKNHTGDRLMASWFAREGARQHLGQIYGEVEIQPGG